MIAMRYGLLALFFSAASMPAAARQLQQPDAGAPLADCKQGDPVATLAQAGHAVLCAASGRRLLIVGEVHGTNEAPDLVAAMAREAAAHRAVRVGVEVPAHDQPALQAYLNSAGTTGDRKQLMATPFWASADGRSSTAMLRLIDGLRARRAAGDDIDIFAMEPVYPNVAEVERAGGFLAVKEAGMSKSIRHALALDKRALVIALMGNFHARYGASFPFAGMQPGSVSDQLASDRPYVLMPFARHTDAWNCMADGCGIHAVVSAHAPSGRLPRLANEVDQLVGVILSKLWLASMSAAVPANSAAAADTRVAPPSAH